ncbi:MAG: hypothetical protein PHR83_14065 [Paludibacter sp.]|nr:hypothetical protein [Paludibacter sp.]
MFIVIPYLTSQPVIYGIYTVCISISIFLAYADLGFMGAGQKYAAEHFARAEHKEELKIIGFTAFILFVFLFLFSVAFLVLSFHPEFIIKNLVQGSQSTIASSLFLILAIFTPVTLLQRVLQLIFGIRLEDYIVQRSNIVASLFKILSVFWFFKNGTYNIVGYFLFVQVANLLASLVTLFIASKRYNYDFRFLLKAVKFDKLVYDKTKGLAFTSLYLTFTWILYYELDPTVIGKFFGANQVAIYAIGLTILSFFRSTLGILFSPFNARFNHFIGLNDDKGLKALYLNVTTLFAPLVVIPIVSVYLMASPLVLTWVGAKYTESVQVTQFLVVCNLFAFITYPAGIFLMAKQRIKEIYFVSTLIPIVFWLGVILTHSFLGVKSFAVFKFVAFAVSALSYHLIMIKYLEISFLKSIKSIMGLLILPLSFLFGMAYLIIDFLPHDKSKPNLLIVAATVLCLIVIAGIIQYIVSLKLRMTVKSVLSGIRS